MARTAVKAFSKTTKDNLATLPTVKNKDNYPAFEQNLEEQTLQLLLTNTLGNTYYASSSELLAETDNVFNKIFAKDPEFFAKAIKYARNYGYMRTVPIYGLAILAKNNHPTVKSIFPNVIRTPNDLSDFLVMFGNFRKGQGGRFIRTIVNDWIKTELVGNEYWAIKYGTDRAKGGYSLKDVIRTFHPKIKNGDNVIQYIVDAEKAKLDETTQIQYFEKLKNSKTTEEKAAAIEAGKLPHEVVTPFIGKDKVLWEKVALNMPILALTRNLATLERHNAFDPAVRNFVEKTYSNKDKVLRSKMFPHQFFNAFEKVNTPFMKDALRSAVELATENLPEIKGSTAVFLDISGSMSGTAIKNGALFALAIMRKTNNSSFYLFDNKLEVFPYSKHDSILTQADTINARGGTQTELTINFLIDKKSKVDNIILITDEQQNTGTPFYSRLLTYQRQINSNVKTFIINVLPYNNMKIANENTPNIYWVYGWTDQVIRYISMVTQGFGKFVEFVKTNKGKKENLSSMASGEPLMDV